MAELSPHTRVGTIVGGRYRVLAVLGRGGMGVLYTAEHMLTQRRVALKLPHVEADIDPLELATRRTRFLVEARTAAAVRHPHIVDVLDMGSDHDGAPFLALELLEGTALDRLLSERKQLAPEETLELLLPIIGALATLHDAGIVHRDVKPSNIFLHGAARQAIQPMLLDFGLAHAVSDPRLTRTGMAMGTPLYMAPEQAAGDPVQPGADVWSMGVVLYECFAGCSPFQSTDGLSLAAQRRTCRIRPLAEVAPHIPPPLAYAVERALRRDVRQRFSTMRELAQGLVIAAKVSQVAIPRDPDPVGLPDIRSWQQKYGALANTVSAAGAITGDMDSESQTGARDLARTPPSPTGPSLQRRRTGLWLSACLFALVVFAGYRWIQATPQATKVAVPLSAHLPASVPASMGAAQKAQPSPSEPRAVSVPDTASLPVAQPVQGERAPESPKATTGAPLGPPAKALRRSRLWPPPIGAKETPPVAPPPRPTPSPFDADREWL